MVGVSLRGFFLLVLVLLAGCTQAAKASSSLADPVLIIDPAELDLGEVDGSKPIKATLLIRNVSDQPAMIAKLASSCGCTDLRAEAMALPAGGFTQLHVTIDPFAKQGKVVKQVTVTDGFGGQSSARIVLRVRPNLHAMTGNRSLFDGKCAKCHFDPAKGLHQGKALYRAVCAMCHGTNGNGGYAPKLRGLPAGTLAATITHGAGTPAMPAFAQQAGGPLTRAQINALVHWLR